MQTSSITQGNLSVTVILRVTLLLSKKIGSSNHFFVNNMKHDLEDFTDKPHSENRASNLCKVNCIWTSVLYMVDFVDTNADVTTQSKSARSTSMTKKRSRLSGEPCGTSASIGN